MHTSQHTTPRVWARSPSLASGPVFEDNVKAWSGDHCVDPKIVPGVFFCNHAIDNQDPAHKLDFTARFSF